jgi:hypothetical protein
VDSVDKPEGWQKLHEDFSEAVDLVYRCARKRRQDEGMDWKKECVHITPKHMEASDNEKLARYTLPTGVLEPLLVRGETLKAMCQLGMTQVCETPAWLHFWNPMKLRMSLRKHIRESYPNMEAFLKLRGRKILLPKSLCSTVARAMIFTQDRVRVTLLPKKVVVEAISPQGNHYEPCPLVGYEYEGPDLCFSVPPKLLLDVVSRESVCEVTESTLRVDNGKCVFVVSLERTA